MDFKCWFKHDWKLKKEALMRAGWNREYLCSICKKIKYKYELYPHVKKNL